MSWVYRPPHFRTRRGGRAFFATVPPEPVSQTATSVFEWRGHLAGIQAAVQEWIQPISASQLTVAEYRSPVAQIRSTPLETLGWVAALGDITRVGVGVQAASNTPDGTITAEYPVGYTVVDKDFAVVKLAGRPSGTLQPNVPAGYTQRNTQLGDVLGTNDVRLTALYRKLQPGDAAPVFTVPNTEWHGAAAGMSVQMAVYRGVDPDNPFDVADAIAEAVAALTWQPPGLATVTPGAWVLSCVASADDNALGLLAGSGQGFALALGGASYHTILGGDHAVGLADKEQEIPGAVTMPTWEQTVNGTDVWVGITLALRPAVGASPVSQQSLIEWTGRLAASQAAIEEWRSPLAVGQSVPLEYRGALAASQSSILEWRSSVAQALGISVEWLQYVSALNLVPIEWQSPAIAVSASQLVVFEWRGPASALHTSVLEWRAPVSAARATPVEWLGRVVQSGTVVFEWLLGIVLVTPAGKVYFVLEPSAVGLYLDPSRLTLSLE